MGGDYSIHIGTVGQGLWRSPDAGQTWEPGEIEPLEGTFRALTAYPDAPGRLLAGSDTGLFRSEDDGEHWDLVDSPMGDRQLWSVALDPADPETIFAGTRPGAFRSRDGGATWEELPLEVADPCPIGIARTTSMFVDPRDRQRVWAGIEVDGVYKSLDGGDSWVRLPDLGENLFQNDIHGLARVPGRATYATSPFGLAASVDEGESWDYHYFPKHHADDGISYCRQVVVKADDPDVMFVANGDGIPGTVGTVQRTRDGGRSWESASLPVGPKSVVYGLGTHPQRPDVVVAASLYGYIYVTEDAGDSWRKLDKEFGEVRSVAVTPR
ncbi:MAG: hypothetical protein OXI03_11090 [Chloroflexota bacterium]|nr:hypothetical protein [Chloroflexota bacterium]